MIKFDEGRMGFERIQRIVGVSPVTYGRVVKKDLKRFYTVVGCHATINNNVEELFVARLNSIMKKKTNEVINNNLNINYRIVDAIIPVNMVTTRKGYLAVDVTLESNVDISDDEIKDFNILLSSIFFEIDMITTYPNNKYIKE